MDRTMTIAGLALLAAALGPAASAASGASARTGAQDAAVPVAQQATEPGAVASVTLYPDRAAVRRTVRLDLKQGLWTVRVPGLPAPIEPSSLQAKVVSPAAGADAPRLLGVEYSATPRIEFASSPEGRELAEKVRDLRRRLERLAQERALLEAHDRLVDQVGIRPSAGGADGATQAIDTAAAARQLDAVAAERRKVLEALRAQESERERLALELAAAEEQLAARGGADRTDRAALVSLAVPAAAAVELEVSYLVPGAGWQPAYTVRASGDRSSVEVEYDALVMQSTGEDWKDVRLALSTAEPGEASEPSEIEPWYVDVVQPVEKRAMAMEMAPGAPAPVTAAAPMAMTDAGPAGNDAAMRARLEELSAAASVQESGVAVSFELPRPVTMASDSSRRQRTRIGAFRPEATFTFVAAPILTESVFLRGDLVNSSAFQMIPGKAQVFMGSDFIGDSAMPGVAPAGEFRVFFGPDRALRARREVLSRVTGSGGIFGGSTVTTWKDRITVDNGTGRDVRVELYDRRPASRNEKIECTLRDPQPALSTDARYVERRMPQGILRWDLSVPASARGPQALPVTWTVEVTRPNDLPTTPIPD